MSMSAKEEGNYLRFCNFLVEMTFKYGANDKEEKEKILDVNKKEGGVFRSTFFCFIYLLLFAYTCKSGIL